MSELAGRMTFSTLFLMMFMAALPAGAQQKLVSGPESSRLAFIARYEDQELAGRFQRFTAELVQDSETGFPVTLGVDVDTGSADMNDRDINDELKQPAWFDSFSFPAARFESTTIRRLDAQRFIAEGHLTLKGSRQPVEVPFSWFEGAEGYSMSGELILSRLAWGIGSGEWADESTIADDVRLSFEVTLVTDN
jgi:polyisoprenoid-binding protein YceI